MTWTTKAEWAQSLQAGDVVLTDYPPLKILEGRKLPVRELKMATVQYIFTQAGTQSGTCVKLKEFPCELDIY